MLTIERARLLAFSDHRAVAGGSEECWNARTTCAQAFGERSLRIELELQFPGKVLPLELLVLANIGGNHLADLPGFKQQPQAKTVDAGVIGNDGQVPDPGIPQGFDQDLGNAAQSKAANRQ